jgi:tetratricopeptide (TPR) repeat protein
MAELDPKSAATSLRSALDVRPDWAQARFVLGSALMLLGDQNGARAELARAVELDAGLVEARRALARIHAALGEHEYAIEQGRIYLRERPDDARTQILVAQSLVALGKADEAYDEILKLPEDQREGDAWYALGRLEMARGNADEARAALLKANEDRPNHADILRSLYRVELLTGDTELAAERVRKAVAEDPTDAGLAQLEGEVAMSAKDMVAAEAAFKRAVELRPDEATAYQRLAAFYRVTGRLDDAISTYQNSLAENPNSARLHERLAILYEFRGDEADAIRAYEEAIDLDSTLGESKNNLAYLLAESGGDLDRALDLAQEAKALLPDNPNTADTLGWVLFKRGIPSAAIGYLREAAASFQEDPRALAVVQHHLASAYEANSQPDEALKAINSALKSIDERAAQVRAEGGEVVEPAWTAEARQMAKRLRGAS